MFTESWIHCQGRDHEVTFFAASLYIVTHKSALNILSPKETASPCQPTDSFTVSKFQRTSLLTQGHLKLEILRPIHHKKCNPQPPRGSGVATATATSIMVSNMERWQSLKASGLPALFVSWRHFKKNHKRWHTLCKFISIKPWCVTEVPTGSGLDFQKWWAPRLCRHWCGLPYAAPLYRRPWWPHLCISQTSYILPILFL